MSPDNIPQNTDQQPQTEYIVPQQTGDIPVKPETPPDKDPKKTWVLVVIFGGLLIIGILGTLLVYKLTSPKNKVAAVDKNIMLTQEVAQSLAFPDGSMIVGEPKAKGSKSTGYDTAEASLSPGNGSISNTIGLFFKSPDGKWQFFTSTQQKLPCTNYTTYYQKYAYLGEPCYAADGTEATVSL